MALIAAVVALNACGDPGMRTCDIRKERCQERTAKATARLRGSDSFVPEINVINYNDFISGVVNEPYTDAQKTSYNTWNEALARLGLSRAGLTLQDAQGAYATSIAGFYDSDTKAITILDRGAPMDSYQNIILLVHELVHAYQDHEGRFDARSEASLGGLDARLAGSAITEGEAELYENLAFLELDNWDSDDIAWKKAINNWRSFERIDSARTALPVYLAGLNFPYAFGTSYIHSAWDARGNEGVRDVYESYPVSAAQVRDGFGADEPEGGWVHALGDAAVPVLGEDYVYFDWDRMGWWILDALCYRTAGYDVPECQPLRDDAFSVFTGPDDSIVAVWRMRFDSDGSARDVHDILDLGLSPDAVSISRFGTDLVLSASSAEAPVIDADTQWLSIENAGPPAVNNLNRQLHIHH